MDASFNKISHSMILSFDIYYDLTMSWSQGSRNNDVSFSYSVQYALLLLRSQCLYLIADDIRFKIVLRDLKLSPCNT